MKNFLKNYLSTILFISITYLFYTKNNYFVGFLNGNYNLNFIKDFSITSYLIFKYVLFLYVILLIPYYIFNKTSSKPRIIIGYLFKKINNKFYTINSQEKVAILSWLVKFFYAPLMIFWLSGHVFTMFNNIYNTFFINGKLAFSDFLYFFNNNFFYMAFSCILFFDVFFFTVGYLTENKILRNEIKSVDSTLFGWSVTLACYPPFNAAVNNIIGWYSTDFPKFNLPFFHIFFNVCILITMSIYAWASISLGFKASNLTNRGIVKKGPYKYVRHPAYFAKNTAWWIGGLPILISSVNSLDFKTFMFAFLSLLSWSGIYYLRAKTEENHLSLDKDYIEYKNNVKYMFIPGVK